MNIEIICFRLVLSLLVGGLLGIERGIKNRPAGLLTYLLVSTSSTLIMLTNLYLTESFPGMDPTRLAAQIVSGIGFLGAGTIITTRRNEIRGLTTAAGLWAAAALGIAIGSGFYKGALAGAISIIFALTGLKWLDVYIKEHAKNLEVFLEYDDDFSINNLKAYLKDQNFTVYDIDRGRNLTLDGEKGTLHFFITLKRLRKHSEILQELEKLEGIENVREIF